MVVFGRCRRAGGTNPSPAAAAHLRLAPPLPAPFPFQFSHATAAGTYTFVPEKKGTYYFVDPDTCAAGVKATVVVA